MKARGMTLIELLVAMAILALLAVLSWRTLDGMTRTESATRTHADAWAEWRIALAQWQTDLDALQDTPGQPALLYDGLVLRLVRQAPARSAAPQDSPALVVVAWALQPDPQKPEGPKHLARWASAPLTQRQALEQAWRAAEQWGHAPTPELRQQETLLPATTDWQLFYHRGDSWTHPQSSDGVSGNTGRVATPVPNGVRLILTLPDGAPVQGTLTRDWVHPRVSGGKAV